MTIVPVFTVAILLASYCWASIANGEYRKYKDPKQPLGARIRDLVQHMTFEEKIGQMI